MSKEWSHDVMICGGGVVGATLAAELLIKTKGSCNIGLVEFAAPKSSIRGPEVAPDVRVYALSPHSIALLKRIGAWKYIEERSKPYTSMQVWESSGPGFFRFSSQDLHADELGRICEDQTIQTAIYQAIRDQGFEFTSYIGSSVSDIKLPASANNPSGPAIVTVQTKDKENNVAEQIISARFVCLCFIVKGFGWQTISSSFV
jgi:2-polyprenyl-6-methoxyphenol hydroxylase-like FAD-dependent oxidoreductase